MAKTVSVMVCVVRDSSMAAAAGLEPKDDGWKATEVLKPKAMATVVMSEVMLRME